MIAKGEAPKKIKWDGNIWEYNYINNTYYCNGLDLKIINLLNDEFEIIEEEPKTWKPRHNEAYWVITNRGYVGGASWIDSVEDELRYEIGNCFKTFEETEKALEKIKIYVRLKRYAEEHNTKKIDWNNDKDKWFICYDYEDKKTSANDTQVLKDIGQISFTSEELCEQAIQEIGEDNIKKLFEEE